MKAGVVGGVGQSAKPLKSSDIIKLATQSFQNVAFNSRESKVVTDKNISLSIFPHGDKSVLISLQVENKRVKWTGVKVTIKPKGDIESEGLSADIDERGQAVIKNVPEGEYVLKLL